MLGKMSNGVVGGNMEEKEVFNPNFKSKIVLDQPKKEKQKKNKNVSVIEELDESDCEYPAIAPRTKDLHFTLNVTLEELYTGKTKKLAVRRKRITTDGKKKNVVEEKKKLSVNIEPGMYDEQVITFNKQADEKEGYETGDIIITLCCAEHEYFEREGNNLIIEKEISLYEAFNCNMTLKHLDETEFNVSASNINIFGDEIDCYRKLDGFGMPIYGSDNKEHGDLIIKFKPVLPTNLTSDKLKILEELFPKLNTVNMSEKLENHELVLATESDFEYSDSEDDEESEEYETETDTEDSVEETDDEESESENVIEEVSKSK